MVFLLFLLAADELYLTPHRHADTAGSAWLSTEHVDSLSVAVDNVAYLVHGERVAAFNSLPIGLCVPLKIRPVSRNKPVNSEPRLRIFHSVTWFCYHHTDISNDISYVCDDVKIMSRGAAQNRRTHPRAMFRPLCDELSRSGRRR